MENKNSKEIFFEFDLPGFSRDEIEVDIKHDSISIHAETKKEKRREEKDFKSYEKSSQDFSYESSLPEIDKEKSKIDFSNGKLKITLYKK